MTNPMLAELDAVALAADYIENADGNVCLDPGEDERIIAALRTHHATLADMAKRLEAAERDAVRLWALHFRGPDDVVAAPSRQAAELAAKKFNAVWDAHKDERSHDVRVVAELIEWDHGVVAHAKSVMKHWPEYADLLDAAMQETGR